MAEIITLVAPHAKVIAAVLIIFLLTIINVFAYIAIKRIHNEIMK